VEEFEKEKVPKNKRSYRGERGGGGSSKKRGDQVKSLGERQRTECGQRTWGQGVNAKLGD